MKTFKNRILRILKSILTLMTGATVTSLFMTESDNWKLLLSITLLLISLERYLSDDE